MGLQSIAGHNLLYISFTPWGSFVINTYSSMILGGGIKLKNLDTENTINVSKESYIQRVMQA